LQVLPARFVRFLSSGNSYNRQSPPRRVVQKREVRKKPLQQGSRNNPREFRADWHSRCFGVPAFPKITNGTEP
jgi:hypothetical protein